MSNYYRDALRTDTLPHISSLRKSYIPAELVSKGYIQDDRGLHTQCYTYNKQLHELQDQLIASKDELKRKDDLLRYYNRLDGSHAVHTGPICPVSAWYAPERHTLEAARAADIAGLQVKVDRTQQRLKECQVSIEKKDLMIKDLEKTVENQKEGEARLTAMLQTLRERLAAVESTSTNFSETELAMSALQMDNKEYCDRLQDLEARHKKLLEEREEAEQKVDTLDKKLSEFVSQIRGILYHGDGPLVEYSLHASDVIVSKISDIVQENTLLKGRVAVMNQSLTDTDIETKANRETIKRLAAEVGREQKSASNMDLLKIERDNAIAAKRDIEKEVELLRERLAANQRALDAARQEISEKDSRLSHLSREMREVDHSVTSNRTHFSLFLEQIAMLLSDPYNKVDASEMAIKDYITGFQEKYKDKTAQIEYLEEKLNHLYNQYDHQHPRDSHCKYSEQEMSGLEMRLKTSEDQLAAAEVRCQQLRHDKDLFSRFLDKLGRMLKLDHYILVDDVDMATDVVLEQLEKVLHQYDDGKTTNVYNMKKNIRSLTEQLDSRDQHVLQLQKKVKLYEDQMKDKTDLERIHESETIRANKFEKLLFKYKKQLSEAQIEINDLKSRLIDSSQMHAKNKEQKKYVSELHNQVQELDQIRKKQCQKIANLVEEVEVHRDRADHEMSAGDNVLQSLSHELKTTKNALHVIQDREKQLMDFRNVVGRMLGLDLATLAIPDYEIITRLEKLVQSQEPLSMYSGGQFTDMEPNFMSGYRNAIAREDNPSRRTRTQSRVKSSNRTRSLSPVRRDPRVY